MLLTTYFERRVLDIRTRTDDVQGHPHCQNNGLSPICRPDRCAYAASRTLAVADIQLAFVGLTHFIPKGRVK